MGPPLGSHLYDLGGLLLPFEIVGIVSTIASLAVYFSLPTTTWTSFGTETIEHKGSKPIRWSDVIKVKISKFRYMAHGCTTLKNTFVHNFRIFQ